MGRADASFVVTTTKTKGAGLGAPVAYGESLCEVQLSPTELRFSERVSDCNSRMGNFIYSTGFGWIVDNPCSSIRIYLATKVSKAKATS